MSYQVRVGKPVYAVFGKNDKNMTKEKYGGLLWGLLRQSAGDWADIRLQLDNAPHDIGGLPDPDRVKIEKGGSILVSEIEGLASQIEIVTTSISELVTEIHQQQMGIYGRGIRVSKWRPRVGGKAGIHLLL